MKQLSSRSFRGWPGFPTPSPWRALGIAALLLLAASEAIAVDHYYYATTNCVRLFAGESVIMVADLWQGWVEGPPPELMHWTFTTNGVLPPDVTLQKYYEYDLVEWFATSGTVSEAAARVGWQSDFQALQTLDDYDSVDNELLYTAIYDYRYHFEVDDYADTPGDTNHVGLIQRQEVWSATNGFVKFNLFASNSVAANGGVGTLPQDCDVFEVDQSAGAFCIETRTGTGSPPLLIEVYEHTGTNLGAFLGSLAITNCYDDTGGNDGITQRLYLTNVPDIGVYVTIRSTDPLWSGSGHIRCFLPRPVVLVHGINAGPRVPEEPNTTFGNMRDSLGFMTEVYPCICYDFPWDSNSDDNGGFRNYVGDRNDQLMSLFDFVTRRWIAHARELRVNIILHSMGGMIVRYQLAVPGFADLVNQVIFIDSPQYGSQVANLVIDHWSFYTNQCNPGLIRYLEGWGTGQVNYRHLCRGGDTVWDMQRNVPLTIPATNVACTIGIGGSFLERGMNGLTRVLGGNVGGMMRGDGVVPAGSQNLQNLDADIEAVYLEKHHLNCQKLDLTHMHDCSALYNLIKRRMNRP